MNAEETRDDPAFPIPSGYKRTEVGVIPNEWDITTLRELGQSLSGGTPSKSDRRYWDGDIPWVSSKDMKVSRIGDAIDRVTELAIGNGTRLVPPGTILMVVRGMSLAHSFPVAIVTHPLTFNQDLKAFVPQAHVCGEFLLRWLQANQTNILLLATEATHGTKRLPTGDLLASCVSLPPLYEQRAIAAALSDVDELIGALDKLVAKKRAIKLAAMQQLLTGKTRLPGFDAAWQAKTIGDLFRERGASCKTGPFGTVLKASEYCKEGLFVVSVGEVGEGTLQIQSQTPAVPPIVASRLPEYILKRGDIVFGRKGAVDRSALIDADDKYFLGSDGIRVRLPETCNPSFVAFQLQTAAVRSWLMQQATGTTMASLNQNVLATVVLSLPTDLVEQEAIASVLSDMDAEITALEQRREKTKAIRQGTMQALLTGRVRLAKPEGA